MQAMQRLLATIRHQLRGLSLNGKLLIGSLMVILAMSLFLVSLYAGDRSMVPLNLPADLSVEARGKAVNFLRDRQIPHEERGGDIAVPSDQRTIVLAQLVDYQLLAADQVNFDKLMLNESPFLSRHQNDRRYLIAKMNEVAAVIRQFQGISNAKVVIDAPAHGGGIGASRIPPTATVTVWTNGRPLPPNQADTIVYLVKGAHAGLTVENIQLTNASTGDRHQARGEDARAAMQNLEARLAVEQHIKDTILSAVSFIPSVRVSVSATVDTREVVSQTTTIEEPRLGMTEESSRNINSSRQPAAAEPGVRANTGVSLASLGGGQVMTDERSSTRAIPQFPNATSRIRDPKGQALVIHASIGVPYSYFVRAWKLENGADAEEPDAPTLAPFVAAESERIRQHILPLIDTSAVDGAMPGQVKVDPFHDVMLAGFGGGGAEGAGGAGGAGAGGGAGGAGFGLDGGLVKYVGLSGLALVSLAMMFFMVRKATTHEELPTAEELVGIPPALSDADSDLIGEAEESSPALEGLEIDDEQLRRQEMLEQISSMVKETPDDAAHLLRKWIQETDR